MTRNVWIFVALAGACVIALVALSGLAWDGGQGRRETGLAAYAEIASVLQSPRCLNCHPRGDRPTQGDDMHVHRIFMQSLAQRSTGKHRLENPEENAILHVHDVVTG